MAKTLRVDVELLGPRDSTSRFKRLRNPNAPGTLREKGVGAHMTIEADGALIAEGVLDEPEFIERLCDLLADTPYRGERATGENLDVVRADFMFGNSPHVWWDAAKEWLKKEVRKDLDAAIERLSARRDSLRELGE